MKTARLNELAELASFHLYAPQTVRITRADAAA